MDSRRPGLLSPWDLLTLAGFALLLGFYHWILPQLPDPVPTHFNAAGVANGWTPKAQLPWVIFGIPLLLWLLVSLTSSGLAAFQEDPIKSRMMAAFPIRGCLGLGVCVLMGSCLGIPRWGSCSILVGVGTLILALVVGLVVLSLQTKEQLARAPDARHYRWGVIYVNPEDPRLWVPKRIGVGWTLNFAKPAAAWVMLLILVAAMAPLLLVLSLKH